MIIYFHYKDVPKLTLVAIENEVGDFECEMPYIIGEGKYLASINTMTNTISKETMQICTQSGLWVITKTIP